MGECLRKACPCLETLWQRIFSDKKAATGGGGGVSGGSAGGRDNTSDGGGEERPPSPGPVPPPRAQSRVPESGSIYTAVWPFEARHQDELSFQEGDLFSVISRSGDWWTARRIDKNGRVLDTGIVPHNYLARAESLKMQP